MSITEAQVKDLIVDEKKVVTEADLKHIQNYKNLILFFENALQESVNTEIGTSAKVLQGSLIKSIRFLDQLMYSYDIDIAKVRGANEALNKLLKTETINENLSEDVKKEVDQKKVEESK